jgi:MFS family permease
MATSRRAWLMWTLGIGAYVVAVFNRSSLGVASLQAQERFHATAAVLSLFAVLQLAVYAAMQIPVGVVLDRFGTRRLVALGALVMAAGQLLLGVSHTVSVAIAARVLVGMGDAMTFISVLRLVSFWFAPRQAPVITQVTGIVGQLGQVAAAYPLVALLHHVGWTGSFVGAAALGAVVSIAVLATLRDAPPGISASSTMPIRVDRVRANLAAAWREPGTRIGLWTHFVTQFSGTVFALLWGYPFLVRGEHVAPTTAGALLSLMVFIAMGVGPLLGALAGRWPRRRSALTLTIVGSSALVWTIVLAWPGTAPTALLLVLVIVLATNGPGSMLGFDYARTSNPSERLGSASGIVKIFVVGVVLDLMTSGGPASYTLGAFRIALSVQYAFWLFGLMMVLRTRKVLRDRLAAQGLALDPLHRAFARKWAAAAARR